MSVQELVYVNMISERIIRSKIIASLCYDYYGIIKCHNNAKISILSHFLPLN